MEQVNRLFSFDALFFILLIFLIYQILLIRQKEWKTILVFHIAGVLNFLLEIYMFINGFRIVETDNTIIIFLNLFSLSWIDIGFFTSIAYINVNYIFRNSNLQKSYLIVLNLLFFIGMPLALGSLWALIPSLPNIGLFAYRTYREDNMLKDGLPGYAEYAQVVRFRLLPGIW